MSTKTTLVCDERADHYYEREADVTVRFGIDGREYEKDVCDGHYRAMARDLEPFISAARPAVPEPRQRSAATRRRAAAIRAWGQRRGLVTEDRGRIPAWVVARYDAENGGRS